MDSSTRPVACRAQLGRLFQILLMLQAPGRPPNARALAEACEVSRRTVYRDLETLAAAGVPVRYHADRQGYGLGPGFAASVPGVALDEVQALLVTVAASTGGTGGLRPLALRAAAKCVAALPAAEQAHARVLADLLTHDPHPPADPVPWARLLEALGQGRELDLDYQEATVGDGRVSVRTRFRAHRLVVGADSPRLIGHARGPDAIIAVPLDRIVRVEATDMPSPPPVRRRPAPRLNVDRRQHGTDRPKIHPDQGFSPIDDPAHHESRR